MNKKEYAMFHYLLAKIKFDLAKDLNISNKNRTLINYINKIEELIIIGDD